MNSIYMLQISPNPTVHCNKNLQNSRRITERETPEGLEPCRNRKTETECETIKLRQQCNDLPAAEQCELTCGRCGKSVTQLVSFLLLLVYHGKSLMIILCSST